MTDKADFECAQELDGLTNFMLTNVNLTKHFQ